MNFNLSKAKVVPYSVCEDEVNNIFLNFVIQGDNSPIDVALQAKITEVRRLYYPVRCYDITYSAEWSATSIWEHKETYTEYKSKTVYVDYSGKEHNSPGFDRYFKGSVISSSQFAGKDTKPWTPISKTVPVTKTKTVVDNVEQTYGEIGPIRSFQPIMMYKNDSEKKFTQWITSTITEKNYGDFDADQIKNSDIAPLVGSDSEAEQSVSRIINSRAQTLCSKKVPGTRYEDLKGSVYDTDYTVEVVLVPVYYISYQYQGQTFHCWINGSRSDVFYNAKPTDETLVSESKALQEQIRLGKSSRLKLGTLVFLVIPIAIIITLFVDFALWIGEPGKLGSGIFFLLLLLAIECMCAMKFSKIHHQVTDQKKHSENRSKKLASKRQAIANIVSDQNMSHDEKQSAIQEILRET